MSGCTHLQPWCQVMRRQKRVSWPSHSNVQVSIHPRAPASLDARLAQLHSLDEFCNQTATAAYKMSASLYCAGLKSDVQKEVNGKPKARMHRREWDLIMAGKPVEINPSVGSGYRVMTVSEWASRWKRNEDFPECLQCGGTNTKEHYFVQQWCRGYKCWESECLCLDCHNFSWRSYKDPDFKTPEQWDKQYWTDATRDTMAALQRTKLKV